MKMALPSGARGYFCFYFFIFSCMLIQLPQISLQLLSCLRIYTSERHFISLINLFSWLPRLGWNAAPLKLTFITTRRTAPGPPRSPTFSSTGAGPCLYFSAYIRMWCQHGISDGPLPSSPHDRFWVGGALYWYEKRSPLSPDTVSYIQIPGTSKFPN